MKRVSFFLMIMLLINAGTMLSSAADSGHQATTAESADQKKQYEKSMEERLGNLGKKLDELKAGTATRGEEVKKEMDRYVAEAEKKQKEAVGKLEAMRKKSVRKWRKFTTEMNAAADDFEAAFEKARTHFKE
jgi:hypothetical protein